MGPRCGSANDVAVDRAERRLNSGAKQSGGIIRGGFALSDIEKQVFRALDTYRSAVLAKNVDAFMRQYAPAVRVFDAWGTWSYEGAAAWRVPVEAWFSSLGSETVEVSFDEVQVTDGNDFASMSAVVTYTAMSAEGHALRAMQNRISWVLRAGDDGVRIVHEHTSAPIGLEDAKAILKREGAP